MPGTERMLRSNSLKAQQKMQCALGRINNNIQKVEDGGSCTLLKKSREQDRYNFSAKDREANGISPDQRCIIFVTLVALDLDARAPFALPLLGSDHRNHLGSGSQEKMDGLELVCMPSAILFPVDRQRERTCSVKPFPSSHLLRPAIPGESRNKVSPKAINISTGSCQQKCFSSNGSSGSLYPDGSSNTGSNDQVKGISKSVKRSCKRKVRKKGNQSRKSTSNVELETVAEEGGHDLSIFEIHAKKDPGHISENELLLEEATMDKDDNKENELLLEEVTNGKDDDKDKNTYVNELGTTRNLSLISLPQDLASGDFRSNQVSRDDDENKISSSGGEFLKKTCSFDEISLDIFSDEYSPPMVDSFSDSWNSDGSISGETRPIIREESFGASPPDARMISDGSNYSTSSCSVTLGTGYLSYGNSCDPGSNLPNSVCISKDSWSKSIRDADNSSSDRVKYGIPSCSNCDNRQVASSKKGIHGRKSPCSLSGVVHRYGNGANTHRQTGKENNHSVWQKVQKNEGDEPMYGQKKNELEKPGRSAFLDETSHAYAQNGVPDAVDVDTFLPSEEVEHSRNRVSEKPRGKPNSGSKLECSNHSRKGLYTGKANLVKPGKTNLYPKEASEISWHAIQHTSFGGGELRSPYLQSHLEETKVVETAWSRVSAINAQATVNLLRVLDPLDQDLLLHKEMPGGVCNSAANEEDNRSMKLETDVSYPEYLRQDSVSGPISQKWIPVGRKDLGLLNPRRTEFFLTNRPDESVSDGVVAKKNGEVMLISDAQGLVSPNGGGVECCNPSLGNAKSPSHGDVRTCGKLNNCAPSLPNQHRFIPEASKLDHKADVDLVSVHGGISNKLVEVVHDAYRLQVVSEGVQLATGNPIAEFERFLRSASPVLVPTFGVWPCEICSVDNRIGHSLCGHQIPNVSLGRIWQWYERPGSYGLEVKGEDYQNSNRMGADRFEFRAYFVPYLSAVQLFGRSRSCLTTSNGLGNKESIEVFETSSTLQHLPILSVLLPKPHKAEDTIVARPASTVYTADSSASGQDDDSELLFEYFESEQPQQRRPLFEKIKELVGGDGFSNCQVYGDPSNLDRLDLHDLHPSSWYSVAWYPIYRIPDGNFRAAFLTYHSLGHFICRSALSNSVGGDTCLVPPVVGLQSYNAQGEGWFAPKIKKEENSSFNPSEILKERLRTLQQTAAVMARATVLKGELNSVNRQPDFEFFLSRRR